MRPLSSRVRKIAVIGGGISGLAAAWTAAQHPNINVTLFEASDRVGGVLETIHDQGYLIERSADNFATLIPSAFEFCRDIGYESQLIRPRTEGRRAFVLNRGRILPIPLGFSLMQPTRLDSMLMTKTLSWAGKVRVAKEYWTPARSDIEDESLESFVTRRLGREAFENLVEPIVSGIFTADPSTLSMAATMPQFLEMERKHGGLIRGYLRGRGNQTQAQSVASRASGARYDQFYAPAKGMSDLLQHIVRALPADCIQLNQTVESLQAQSIEGMHRWRIKLSNSVQNFDGVIVALPTVHASNLLHDSAPVASQLIGSIRYASSAVVVLVVNKSEIKGRIDGFGLIVPRKEHRKTLAISYSSNKYPGRVPDDQFLLRIFLGGALAPDLVDESDEKLIKLAESELREILGWTGTKARWQAVVRWKNAMPQYLVGHLKLIKQIEESINSLTNLEICGAGYRGVGIPQCVRDGRRAAEAVVANLS
jgi:protoporphyrinogen/coproporphyrinogen III oxidase